MKTRFFYTVISFILVNICSAQVLFTEDFNSYALGELSTDPTGVTPGKGNWYVKKIFPNNPAPCEIVAETGRGNVLAIGGNINFVTLGNSSVVTQQNIDVLWNSRTKGNNILKLEYDVYTSVHSNIIEGRVLLMNLANKPTIYNIIDNLVAGQPSAVNAQLQAGYYTSTGTQLLYLGANNTPNYANFPYNSWISVQLFVEYQYEGNVTTSGNVYVYIPALNILKAADFKHSEIIELLMIEGGSRENLPVAVKYDNIKLTALNTLPTYLGVENFISQKFNVYPNPATSIVNISNAKNMLVNQITVYDMAGKQLSTQSFNNEAEVQLNVEHLQSGTYMLHLQTNEGTAVKKLVKK